MKDGQILDSWKEITEYLGRSRKTCLRWEKEFGLPIHRLDGTPKARVFAYKDELDRWLEETLKGKKKLQKLSPAIFTKSKLSTQSMKFIIPALIFVFVLIAAAVLYFNRQSNIRWAKYIALPEIQRIKDSTFYQVPSRENAKLYRLAQQASKYIPKDEHLLKLWPYCVLEISIKTTPPGANVYMKDFIAENSDWEFLGVAPLEKARVPYGYFKWKMEKEGYEEVVITSSSFRFRSEVSDIPIEILQILDKEGEIPTGMVRVKGIEEYEDFFIDKYEVTNKQFKIFVDSGGYQTQEYWMCEFIKGGKILTWEEAMAEFRDTTGRPGPSTWQAGDYPEGQEDYPVSGVCWYEAAAYAEWSGKSLPTVRHWNYARGGGIRKEQMNGIGWELIIPNSNFGESGPVRVGSFKAVKIYEVYDMAGNVREWCWNESPKGHCLRGGAWSDFVYMYDNVTQATAFNRSAKNGFRCAKYLNRENIPEAAFKAYKPRDPIDYYKETPVSDSIFEVYKRRFLYDQTDLNAKIEKRDESAKDWNMERITFDTAYGDERMIAHLFLPKKFNPPYQTVIYFPGTAVCLLNSSENLEIPLTRLDFILKNGRAVMFPVYYGTYERQLRGNAYSWKTNQEKLEGYVNITKDFKRSIDYLETRDDIDIEKLAYYGFSWGGLTGNVLTVLDERIKVSILFLGGILGGFDGRIPELALVTYLPRVKIPTLMLNGRYDLLLRYEERVKPMFDLLGTPEKKLKLYDVDHTIPKNELIKEVLAWLDRYLGQANQESGEKW